MRVEYKQFYYFELEDKERFNNFLDDNGINMSDFATKCDISLTLLSLVVNGKRAITKNVLEQFERNGFIVDYGDIK